MLAALARADHRREVDEERDHQQGQQLQLKVGHARHPRILAHTKRAVASNVTTTAVPTAIQMGIDQLNGRIAAIMPTPIAPPLALPIV
ncbi:hypothetical protein GCM10009557_60510 [Virgisporangium ochraceum]|uniref:Uncharacterized protein n=1 Tax=Virgisporangium ochraceum TaxID=65505 RepID=A0A8J3ZUE8_9ACTN|nr:hypothetical protein Voc01_052990 [Virgisporangium ochraceum]